MKPKMDMTAILGIAAAIVGVAGTLLSNIASQKQMDAKITEEVKKALEKK